MLIIIYVWVIPRLMLKKALMSCYLIPDLKLKMENFVFEVIFRQKQGVKNILVCAGPEFSFSLKNLIRIQVVSAESIQK